jgi:hypothetical protein
MLALLYLAAMTYFGDRVCRNFFRFVSGRHRLAVSFLTGLLLSTWITYLGALTFAWSRRPLVMGNIIFLLVFVLAIYKLPLRPAENYYHTTTSRYVGSNRWDWICLGAFLIFTCWLMFATLNFKDGQFQISYKSWTDFGANLSLAQSFALGHNFPTEHPYFPGEIIRYHFLFWFQAANLEFLGFKLVWGVNLLSILSMLALLMLIMTFAEVLFGSRRVGRLAAFLFFFSSSLSYLLFLRSQLSFRAAMSAVLHADHFLASGYPFRGEDWGVLTISVFVFQRHLISAVGILLVVLIFLVDRYKDAEHESEPAASLTKDKGATKRLRDAGKKEVSARQPLRPQLKTFIFSGALIGLLPYWNSAIFVSAVVVLGSIFLLFSHRLYSAILIVTALLIGLPQVLMLRAGNIAASNHSLLHWGYTLDQPTLALVVKYLGWSFGLKWLAIFIALIFLSNFHRRLFVAVTSLLAVVFLFQLSTDLFNNHKLLNVWAVFASIYAAYALRHISKIRIVGVALAVVLAVGIILGGIIDLFPLHNDEVLTVPYENDRLSNWILTNTQPSDVFLTDLVLTHPILFTGRKIFLGYTLFAWSAGYDVPPRENLYHRMFQERDPVELVRLLNANRIAYVCIDDGVRGNKALNPFNESVYRGHFQKVFEDTEHRYENLTIYKVPGAGELSVPQVVPSLAIPIVIH